MPRARPHAHSLVMNVAPFAIYLVVLGLLLATMLVALTVAGWLSEADGMSAIYH